MVYLQEPATRHDPVVKFCNVALSRIESVMICHANNMKCTNSYEICKNCFLPSLHKYMVSNFLKLSMKQSTSFYEWQEHKATHMAGIAVAGKLDIFNFF
jgi:hypothetical protein